MKREIDWKRWPQTYVRVSLRGERQLTAASSCASRSQATCDARGCAHISPAAKRQPAAYVNWHSPKESSPAHRARARGKIDLKTRRKTENRRLFYVSGIDFCFCKNIIFVKSHFMVFWIESSIFQNWNFKYNGKSLKTIFYVFSGKGQSCDLLSASEITKRWIL